MKFYRLIFFFAVLILARESYAQWPAQLVNSASRPTVTEIRNALSKWPEKALGSGVIIDPNNITPEYVGLAKAIVSLEAAFPGGTYAFLGRDSAIVADAFDAFYQSIGQNGRAVHLNASTESFAGSDDQIITEFLETSGLNFKDPLSRPFIMIDTTSYSTGSQSRRLLSAAYRRLTASGFLPKDLIRKVNFVSFTQGQPIADFANYFSTTYVDANGPHLILLNPPGLATYTAAWHGPFLPFQKSAKGVIAPPGTKASGFESMILDQIYGVVTVVSSSKFINTVVATAREQSVPLAFEPTVFEKAFEKGEKLKDLLLKLKREGKLEEETKNRLWAVGTYSQEFLTILPELQRQGFGVRELRRIAKVLIFDPEAYAKFLDSVQINSRADYLALASPVAKGIADSYRFALDDFILKTLPTFKKLGATPEDILSLEAQSLKRRRNKVKLWNEAVALFPSPKDALMLFRSPKNDMGGQYQMAKEKFIVETVKKYARYPWSLEETLEIQKLLKEEVTTLEFLDIVLKNVSTVSEYETLMSHYLFVNWFDTDRPYKENILKKVLPIIDAEIAQKGLVGPEITSFAQKFGAYSNVRMALLKESKTPAEFLARAQKLINLGGFPDTTHALMINIMEFFVQLNPTLSDVEMFHKRVLEYAIAGGVDKKQLAFGMMNLHTSRKSAVLAPFYQTPDLAIDWAQTFFMSYPSKAALANQEKALFDSLSGHKFTVAQLNQILMASTKYPKWSYDFLSTALPSVTDPENLKSLATQNLGILRRAMAWYQARTLRLSAPKPTPIQCSRLLGI